MSRPWRARSTGPKRSTYASGRSGTVGVLVIVVLGFGAVAANRLAELAGEPQARVDPEEGDHPGQEQLHETARVVQDGAALLARGVGVRVVLHEVRAGPGMAPAARGDLVVGVDG